MNWKYRIKSQEEYELAYHESVENPEKFWDNVATQFIWNKAWSKTLEYNFDNAQFNWFVDGKLNITENCLDRHLDTIGDKNAIIWESNFENEESISITYKELHRRVIRFAQVLKKNGINKGDRVCINMGMIPELAIAVLACARIGAIHSVIFGGFSAASIADRLEDAEAKHAQKISNLNSKKKELSHIIEETEKEEKELSAQAAELETHIEERLLNAYTRIRKNYKNGLAVVNVERNACGGCFGLVPAQTQAEIRTKKRIISCEHCGRILYGVKDDVELSAEEIA